MEGILVTINPSWPAEQIVDVLLELAGPRYVRRVESRTRRSGTPKNDKIMHPVIKTLVQREHHNANRDSRSYPPIPHAEMFFHNYGHEKPTAVYGWQWSTTFGRWSAFVTFTDGWQGFTYPKGG